MRVGIIGTGNIGGTLARKLVATGHSVYVTNSGGIEGARSFANEIGAKPVDAKGAVTGTDLIIVSIPFPAIKTLKGLFDDLPQNVPVVDTGNYYPKLRDPQISEIDEGKTESVWVSEQIGHPVIKAFNNIPVYSLAELGRPEGDAPRIAIAVAGDNTKHKKLVMKLINDDIGFDPVDSGSLEDSWRQQPCTRAYCCDWNAGETIEMLAAQVKGEASERLMNFPAQLMALGATPEHEEVIALNRSLYGLE